MRILLSVIIIFFVGTTGFAQNKVTFHVADDDKKPVAYVAISKNGELLASTDSFGNASASLPDGPNKLILDLLGYKKVDTTLDVKGPGSFSIMMIPEEQGLEEVTFVSSTRTNQRIENSAMKVEVLGNEELQEESTVKPGNIASLISDVSGIQIQQTSAASGNSAVRIQGLDGKYTQILRDGMPLYEGFSGGFGILTIPPLDLKQIELIKGSASTLYGGGAISGLVNLISRKPTMDQTADFVVNYSTLNEFNTDLFLAKRNEHFGYTFFSGFNKQAATDVNGDGLSDVPQTQSVILHPRLYYYPDTHTSMAVGYIGSFDDRKGGDMNVLNNDPVAANGGYFEENRTARNTGELLIDHSYDNDNKLTIKGNISDFDRIMNANTDSFQGRQLSYYGEVSMLIPQGKNSLVAGINITGDRFAEEKPANSPLANYELATAGIFAQYNWQFNENGNVEAGLRMDKPEGNSFFALPRVAGFYRLNKHWAARAGFAMGYKMPDPVELLDNDTARTDAIALNPNLKAELSYGYNAEVNYKYTWDDNSIFINQAFFRTDINNPIYNAVGGGVSTLVNLNTNTTTEGSDTYMKLTVKKWELYLGYTYTIATNDFYTASNGWIPLTSRNRMAFVISREFRGQWKLGYEGSWYGKQYRDDGSGTPSYFITALMISRGFGKHITLVLNGENLLDYRMSRVESLYTGSFSDPVFKPLWAPIDGRVINLSFRWKLGGS